MVKRVQYDKYQKFKAKMDRVDTMKMDGFYKQKVISDQKMADMDYILIRTVFMWNIFNVKKAGVAIASFLPNYICKLLGRPAVGCNEKG